VWAGGGKLTADSTDNTDGRGRRWAALLLSKRFDDMTKIVIKCVENAAGNCTVKMERSKYPDSSAKELECVDLVFRKVVSTMQGGVEGLKVSERERDLTAESAKPGAEGKVLEPGADDLDRDGK